MCYLIENGLYEADISNIIINEFSKHLHGNYGMCNFYTFSSSNNNAMVEFWKRNNFEKSRITSNFLKIDSEDKDIIILKKTIHK